MMLTTIISRITPRSKQQNCRQLWTGQWIFLLSRQANHGKAAGILFVNGRRRDPQFGDFTSKKTVPLEISSAFSMTQVLLSRKIVNPYHMNSVRLTLAAGKGS
jgi:hypothetical protein